MFTTHWHLAPQIKLRAEARSALLFRPQSAETLHLDLQGLLVLRQLYQGKWFWQPRALGLKHYLYARGFIRPSAVPQDNVALENCWQRAQSLKTPLRSLSAPEALHISLTDACNQTCQGCFFSNQTPGQPNRYMSLKRFQNIIDQAAKIQVFQVALGGGEPLMHPQLLEMVTYASQAQIVPNLTTNGYLLARELGDQILSEFRAAGLGQLQLSLNGSTAEIHGLTRPHFESLLPVFERVQKSQLRWGINCLVTAQNIGDLEAILQLAQAKGAVNVNFLRPKPALSENWHEEVALSSEQNQKLALLLPQWQRKYRLQITTDTSFSFLRQGTPSQWEKSGLAGCSAGRRIMSVQVDGRISPCSHVALYDGGDDLLETWQNSAHLKQFRTLEETLTGACQTCRYKSVCRGCRALVLQQRANFYGTDNACPKHQPIS